jgi:hypothetical protein
MLAAHRDDLNQFIFFYFDRETFAGSDLPGLHGHPADQKLAHA